MRIPALLSFTVAAAAMSTATGLPAADDPLSAESKEVMNQRLDAAIAEIDKRISAGASNVDDYSRRGDALFFRARFPQAVADYERMVELKPELEASHWRRGIAYYFAGRYKQAAHQFEIYHTHDDVDRENGIWRYFCQAKVHGIDTARKNLLKYRQDDREPFPALYRLFEGTATADDVLQQIPRAKLDVTEREKRLFYAHLYIGLNDTLEERRESAIEHLKKSVRSTWGRRGGYGPQYMWHVGRLELNRLTAAKESSEPVN